MAKHEYTVPTVVELGAAEELILGSNVRLSEIDPDFQLPQSLVDEYDE